MTMTYRYLRKPPPRAQEVAAVVWPFPMRTRQASFNSTENRLYVVGVGSNDLIGYFTIAPDGSGVNFINSASIRAFKRSSPSGFVSTPACYIVADTNGARVWGVTPSLPEGIDLNSDGRFTYQITSGSIFESASGGGANNGPNFLSLQTIVEPSSGIFTRRRRTVRDGLNSQYSNSTESLSITPNQPPTNATYTNTPIQVLKYLDPSNLLVGYTSGATTKWDVWVNSIRTHIDVPLVSDAHSVNSTIEVRGNVVCLYGANKAVSAVWNGGGSFTVQSQIAVPTTGKAWPVTLADGRILVGNQSPNSRCLSFNPSTGFTLAGSQFQCPLMYFATLHPASGRLIIVTGTGATVSLLEVPS